MTSTVRPLILVVADDPSARDALARAVEKPGVEVLTASDVAEADAALGRGAVDVVLADLGDPARDALALVHVLRERSPDLPVVALASPNDAGAAIELYRHGAFVVLPRDNEPAILHAALSRAAEHHLVAREATRLRRETRGQRDRVPLLGRSERLREMNRQVDELATRPVPVLLLGEPGTGRRLVARELHQRSPRAAGPFVSATCRDMAEVLLESQLFGHRRGAFAGAIQDHDGAFRAALGGTLLIEHVDQLPVRLQEKLVGALGSGEVLPLGAAKSVQADVRVLFASTRDLAPMVRAGTFREDLHRRIAAVALHLPPLRERREDVVFLAEAFAAEMAERFGVANRRFDAAAQEALLAHPWPGNVRELREAVERAFAREVGESIGLASLPASVRAGARSGQVRPLERLPTLAEAEAELVALVLEDSSGNKTEAARRLGIDRKRLYRKIGKYRLLGEAPGHEAGTPLGD